MLTFTMSALHTESKAFSALAPSMFSETGTHTCTVPTLDITTCLKRLDGNALESFILV